MYKRQVETEYPWNGTVEINVENEEDSAFTYAIRIPNWCEKYKLTINGEIEEYNLEKGYIMLEREWRNGDKIVLSMDMPVVLVEANPKVREDIGKVAVMRGPIVYCVEEVDNGAQLQEVYLEESPEFDVCFEENLLKGVVTLTTEGKRVSENGWSEVSLYRTYKGKEYQKQQLKFIPYYSWTNRGVGEMSVWVRI